MECTARDLRLNHYLTNASRISLMVVIATGWNFSFFSLLKENYDVNHEACLLSDKGNHLTVIT